MCQGIDLCSLVPAPCGNRLITRERGGIFSGEAVVPASFSLASAPSINAALVTRGREGGNKKVSKSWAVFG